MTLPATSPQAAALQAAITQSAVRGWRLEGAYGGTATMVSGHEPNHVVHLLLTLATCGLWAVVWLYAAATSGTRRMVVTVDDDGNVNYQLAP